MTNDKEHDLGAHSAAEGVNDTTAAAPIEVRMAEGADPRMIDEIVIASASVHLEQMSETEYVLIVETATERACFSIHAASTLIRPIPRLRRLIEISTSLPSAVKKSISRSTEKPSKRYFCSADTLG